MTDDSYGSTLLFPAALPCWFLRDIWTGLCVYEAISSQGLL